MTLGSLHNFLSPGASTRLLPNVIILLNLNFHFTSKWHVSSNLSNLLKYHNIIHACQRRLFICKHLLLSKCRTTNLSKCRKHLSTKLLISWHHLSKELFCILISWRQKCMYTVASRFHVLTRRELLASFRFRWRRLIKGSWLSICCVGWRFSISSQFCRRRETNNKNPLSFLD